MLCRSPICTLSSTTCSLYAVIKDSLPTVTVSCGAWPQIKAAHRTEAGSIKEPPLNLVEAGEKLNPSIAVTDGLANVTPLLERSRSNPLNSESSSFWIMVRAESVHSASYM
jgi:hypothetical protein